MFHFLGRRAVSAVFHYCIGHLPLLSRQRRLHIRLLGRCRTKDGGLLTEMVTMRLVCCPTSLRCRSEEHTSELQSRFDLVCRLLLEKKNSTVPRAVWWRVAVSRAE